MRISLNDEEAAAPTIHLHQTTILTPEQYLAGLSLTWDRWSNTGAKGSTAREL